MVNIKVSLQQNEDLKHFQFYRDSGKDALFANHFEDALQHFQKALPIATDKLLDSALVKEIKDLIAKTEQSIAHQQAKTEQANAHQQALKTYSQLLEQAKQAFQANQLNSAMDLLKKVHIIGLQNRLDTTQETDLTNQIEIKQMFNKATILQSASRWDEALDQFQQLYQKSAELGWKDWAQFISDQMLQLNHQIQENNRLENERIAREEASLNDPMLFNGVIIIKRELLVLQELERIFNRLFNTNSTSDPGFQIENQHVIRLDLNGLGLSALPDSLFNLKSLQTLSLSANQLASLSENIGNLKSLINLNLSSNKLTTLPDVIGNLNSLIYLNISNNQLSSLPGSIGNLNSIQKLDISYNKLSILPDSIGNLTALKELYLNQNKLNSLPESIGNLNSLKELNLAGNSLTLLPDTIQNLTSLTFLDLSGKQLIYLPGNIKNALKILEKRKCKIVR